MIVNFNDSSSRLEEFDLMETFCFQDSGSSKWCKFVSWEQLD